MRGRRTSMSPSTCSGERDWGLGDYYSSYTARTGLCRNCNSHPAPNHVRRSTWRGSYLCAYPACVPGIALRARRNVSMCRNQPPSVPPASPLAVEYRVDYPPCTGCASFRLIKVAKQLPSCVVSATRDGNMIKEYDELNNGRITMKTLAILLTMLALSCHAQTT